MIVDAEALAILLKQEFPWRNAAYLDPMTFAHAVNDSTWDLSMRPRNNSLQIEKERADCLHSKPMSFNTALVPAFFHLAVPNPLGNSALPFSQPRP